MIVEKKGKPGNFGIARLAQTINKPQIASIVPGDLRAGNVFLLPVRTLGEETIP